MAALLLHGTEDDSGFSRYTVKGQDIVLDLGKGRIRVHMRNHKYGPMHLSSLYHVRKPLISLSGWEIYIIYITV